MILILISIILVIIIVIISVYYYNKFIKNKDKCKNADYPVITHKKQINGFPNLNMGDVCWKNEEDINKYCINDNVKPFAKAAHDKKFGIEFTKVKFCNDKIKDLFIKEYMNF